jgi:DNA-binding CsgD family transcriptional regulator
MSAAELRRPLRADPLPSPPGLAVVANDAEVEGDCLVLSFPIPSGSDAPARLTPAEREVVDGILAGLPTREIAVRRGVSPRTVANQISHIFEKMRVGSRLALALSVHGAGPADAPC